MGINDFFIEAYNRIRSKSPKFFFVVQCFAASLIVLGRVPQALERWTSLAVSDHFINFCKDVSIVGIGLLSGSFLPVKSPTIAQTDTGEAVKVTNEKKMPFTAKDEAKTINETIPEPPVMDVPK